MRSSFHRIIAALIITLFGVAIVEAQAPALLLYGGNNHRVFLGCLNCGRFDVASVCNKCGTYGSRFSADSIWNGFGEYGSRFSVYSPWNRFSTEAPVVVDGQGNFYGYFTSNRYQPKRTDYPFFVAFLDHPDKVNQDLEAARNSFCGD
jgi:hypothetical protein